MRPLRVLYVDDEPDNLDGFELNCGERWKITLLQEPRPVYTGDVKLEDFDILFLDLVLLRPDEVVTPFKAPNPSEGLKLLGWVHAQRPKMPVLIVTGIIDRNMKRSLEEAGPWIRYFEKPVNFGEKGFAEKIEEFVAEQSAS
jgi:DNA-binding NtrC family response regulator